MCPYIYFITSSSISEHSSFHVAMLLYNVAHVWFHMESYTIGKQHIFSTIGTQLNDKCEEENWDHFN